jgi:hypothetical protein
MPLSFLTMTLALAFMWFLCAPHTLVPDRCLAAKHNTASWLAPEASPAYISSGAQQLQRLNAQQVVLS